MANIRPSTPEERAQERWNTVVGFLGYALPWGIVLAVAVSFFMEHVQ